MAGQIIINFDGLTAEAAAKLAQGQVDAVKAKIKSTVRWLQSCRAKMR